MNGFRTLDLNSFSTLSGSSHPHHIIKFTNTSLHVSLTRTPHSPERPSFLLDNVRPCVGINSIENITIYCWAAWVKEKAWVVCARGPSLSGVDSTKKWYIRHGHGKSALLSSNSRRHQAS